MNIEHKRIRDFLITLIIFQSYLTRLKCRHSYSLLRGKRLVTHAGAGRRVGWLVTSSHEANIISLSFTGEGIHRSSTGQRRRACNWPPPRTSSAELRLHNHFLCPSRLTSDQLTRINDRSHILRSVDVAMMLITVGDDSGVLIAKRRHIVEREGNTRRHSRVSLPHRLPQDQPRESGNGISPSLVVPSLSLSLSLLSLSLPLLSLSLSRFTWSLRLCGVNLLKTKVFTIRFRSSIHNQSRHLRTSRDEGFFFLRGGNPEYMSASHPPVGSIDRRRGRSGAKRSGVERRRASSEPLLLRSRLLPVTTTVAPLAIRNHFLVPRTIPNALSPRLCRYFNHRERRSALHPLFIENGAGALPNSI